MQRSSLLFMAAFLAVALWSAHTLYRGFRAPFERGNAYERYSSYRTDPMGMRVLYEALDDLPGVEARRNTTPLSRLRLDPEATLIISGAVEGPDPKSIAEKLEEFVFRGGRLVVLYRPTAGGSEAPFGILGPGYGNEEEEEDAEGEAEGEIEGEAEDAPGEEEEDPFPGIVNFSERWGYGYMVLEAREDDGPGLPEYLARKVLDTAAIPDTLRWRSSAVLHGLDSAWEVIYARAPEDVPEEHRDERERAVCIERFWGDGEIVLATDSYQASNEAMLLDRQPAYLAWLVDGRPVVVFEETHHGVEQGMGLMALLRAYRLDYLLVVLALVGLLFVWRGNYSLCPRPSTEEELRTVRALARAEGAAGLSQVLRRSAPRRQLPHICLSEWMKDNPAHASDDPTRLDRMRSHLLEPGARFVQDADVILAYNAMRRIAQERNPHRE